MISAGIVLYNPDIARLTENINAIKSQVNVLYLIDNGSDNILDVKRMTEKCLFGFTYVILRNEKNLGIATALNQLCEKSKLDGNQWILTLDQDSVSPKNIVKEYAKIINDDIVAMVCPNVSDRNMPCKSLSYNNKLDYVDECITSGSMLRLEAWEIVGGFDDFMFIDGVDFDICHRLIKNGYKIIRVNNVLFVHELGNIEVRKFLNWNVIVKNHTYMRKYYISRNTIYLAKKEQSFLRTIKAYLQNLKMIFIVLLYEKNKTLKIKSIFKGLIDGFSS